MSTTSAVYARFVIARLEGLLVSVTDGHARVRCGEITYELLVPACDAMRLAADVGQRIIFETLHYLESQGQGASYIPRLIGFASLEDRAFFELFTTVKGIGNRKALRAMQMRPGQIATAIAERDIQLLKSLPEIGKKTAETIIVELKDKVAPFAAAHGEGTTATVRPINSAERDAMRVLVTLGESPLAARQLVERAAGADPSQQTADELITAALRLRET